MPFRTIVSERGTWERHVSVFFLLTSLKCLHVKNPYLIKNLDEVEFFRDNDDTGYLFSVDVNDLCSSCRAAVNDAYAKVAQPISFLGLKYRIRILLLCWNSIFVFFEDGTYLEKQGTCIGSCVATILCENVLSCFDQALKRVFISSGVFNVTKAFTHVDHFLIVLDRSRPFLHHETVETILGAFRTNAKGLPFTHVLPAENSLRFLDILLTDK